MIYLTSAAVVLLIITYPWARNGWRQELRTADEALFWAYVNCYAAETPRERSAAAEVLADATGRLARDAEHNSLHNIFLISPSTVARKKERVERARKLLAEQARETAT